MPEKCYIPVRPSRNIGVLFHQIVANLMESSKERS